MASNITVSGLVVAPGIQSNFAQWEVSDPNINGLPYLKFAAAELWAATSNDRSTATKVAEGVTSAAYVYTGLAKRYHWVRARDVEGSTGDWYPSSSTAGIVADGVWQNFSPTITPSSGTFTDATLISARYFRLGPNVTFAIAFDINTAGTASGYLSFTLPVNTGSLEYPVSGMRTLISYYSEALTGYVSGSSGRLYGAMLGSSPNVNDDAILRWGGIYEAAS